MYRPYANPGRDRRGFVIVFAGSDVIILISSAVCEPAARHSEQAGQGGAGANSTPLRHQGGDGGLYSLPILAGITFSRCFGAGGAFSAVAVAVSNGGLLWLHLDTRQIWSTTVLN